MVDMFCRRLLIRHTFFLLCLEWVFSAFRRMETSFGRRLLIRYLSFDLIVLESLMRL